MVKKKAGVFISGSGTNLRSIIKSSRDYNFPININLIISNKKDAKGITRYTRKDAQGREYDPMTGKGKGQDYRGEPDDEEWFKSMMGGGEPDDKPFGGDSGTDADFQGEPPEGAREPDDIDDDELEEKTIIINGKKYRPIKEKNNG